MRLLESIRKKVRAIVRRAWPHGLDRQWSEWVKNVVPEIVQSGPPADLSEKETSRGKEQFLVDL